MKKTTFFLAYICLFTITSCHDDDLQSPSTINTKEWSIDKNMNTYIKPGDNFAMYCWGTWYDNTTLADGESCKGLVYDEANAAVLERMKNLTVPQLTVMQDDFSRLSEDRDNINRLKQKINQLETLKTPEEQAYALGEYLKDGNTSYLKGGLIISKGKFYYLLDTNNVLSDLLESTTNKNNECAEWLKWALTQLDLDEDQAEKRVEEALKIQLESSMLSVAQKMERYKKPEYHESLVSAKRLMTRALNEENPVLSAFFEGLGIDEENVMFESSAASFLNGLLEYTSRGGGNIISILECGIAADLALTSKMARDKLLGDGDETQALAGWTGNKMNYTIAKIFCENYISENLKKKMSALMEELRGTFKDRMEKIDWMSGTTKQNAIDKLQKMTFHIATPDKWYEEGIPRLEGKSLYDDMCTLRKTQFNLYNILLDKRPQDEYMNYVFSSDDVSVINASYDFVCNTICIMPNIMLEPFYSENAHDARLYAMGFIFGHEMTHGFDDIGKTYDADGNLKNWWTIADQMAFTERTNLLVDCYNHLPLYMDSDEEHVNGTMTLGENIADLGGLEIAHQAYVEKLKRQGYSGKELIKQEKRFFQAAMNIWRGKLSNSYINELHQTNEHAHNIARVNGTTMNCDRWYELYNVKWGDMNYLAPEKRTRIW